MRESRGLQGGKRRNGVSCANLACSARPHQCEPLLQNRFRPPEVARNAANSKEEIGRHVERFCQLLRYALLIARLPLIYQPIAACFLPAALRADSRRILPILAILPHPVRRRNAAVHWSRRKPPAGHNTDKKPWFFLGIRAMFWKAVHLGLAPNGSANR